MSCRRGVVPPLHIISGEMLHHTSEGVLPLLLETKIGYAETRDEFGPHIVKPFRLGYLTLNGGAKEPAFKGRERFCLIYLQLIKNCLALCLLVSYNKV
jgi:hypothetical protein